MAFRILGAGLQQGTPLLSVELGTRLNNLEISVVHAEISM
jgi:hypothetical protein